MLNRFRFYTKVNINENNTHSIQSNIEKITENKFTQNKKNNLKRKEENSEYKSNYEYIENYKIYQNYEISRILSKYHKILLGNNNKIKIFITRILKSSINDKMKYLILIKLDALLDDKLFDFIIDNNIDENTTLLLITIVLKNTSVTDKNNKIIKILEIIKDKKYHYIHQILYIKLFSSIYYATLNFSFNKYKNNKNNIIDMLNKFKNFIFEKYTNKMLPFEYIDNLTLYFFNNIKDCNNLLEFKKKLYETRKKTLLQTFTYESIVLHKIITSLNTSIRNKCDTSKFLLSKII